MSVPSGGGDSELRKYAPKWAREQPTTPDAGRPQLVSTASTVPALREEFPDRRIRSLRPEPVPEPPAREHGLLASTGQMALVAVVAAAVALLVVFGQRLLEGVSPQLNSDSQTKQVSRPPDPLTTSNTPANRALVPAAGIVATP